MLSHQGVGHGSWTLDSGMRGQYSTIEPPMHILVSGSFSIALYFWIIDSADFSETEVQSYWEGSSTSVSAKSAESMIQKYKAIEKDPLTRMCIGGSMVERCLLIPETRVQFPCPTPWCDSIDDMSIFLAKKKPNFLWNLEIFFFFFFYELIDKVYELHLRYC